MSGSSAASGSGQQLLGVPVRLGRLRPPLPLRVGLSLSASRGDPTAGNARGRNRRARLRRRGVRRRARSPRRRGTSPPRGGARKRACRRAPRLRRDRWIQGLGQPEADRFVGGSLRAGGSCGAHGRAEAGFAPEGGGADGQEPRVARCVAQRTGGEGASGVTPSVLEKRLPRRFPAAVASVGSSFNARAQVGPRFRLPAGAVRGDARVREGDARRAAVRAEPPASGPKTVSASSHRCSAGEELHQRPARGRGTSDSAASRAAQPCLRRPRGAEALSGTRRGAEPARVARASGTRPRAGRKKKENSPSRA